MSEITLANLGGGAAVEKFGEELEKAINNILDPNTLATAKREVTLKVIITPNNDRTWGGMRIETSAKLAPHVAYQTRAFFGHDKALGRNVVCEDDTSQVTIDDFIKRDNEVQRLENAATELIDNNQGLEVSK